MQNEVLVLLDVKNIYTDRNTNSRQDILVVCKCLPKERTREGKKENEREHVKRKIKRKTASGNDQEKRQI